MSNMCPTVTTITCTMEQGHFPVDSDPCYLAQKAEVAIRLPMRITTKLGLVRYLNQVVMSGLIRIEERQAQYYWPYKAEVVFAIKDPVPVPMLATSSESKNLYGEDLPQSSNIFACPSPADWKKHSVKRMRRPDIILVKDEMRRWPGRAATYFDGKPHPDNLKMLIEVKFPGDTLSKGQEVDYQAIATRSRFGVMRVNDNRSDEQREYDRQYNLSRRPSAQRYVLPPLLSPVPIPELPKDGAPGTIPQPLSEYLPLLSKGPWSHIPSVEDWLLKADYVESLTKNGWDYVREETRQKFHQFGDWVKESGQWVFNEVTDTVTTYTKYGLRWINDRTGELMDWSSEQLQELWLTVKQGMDITVSYLRNINWVQIIQDIGDGTVQLLLYVKEVLTVVIVAVAVAAALILLVAAMATGAGEAIAAVLLLVGGGSMFMLEDDEYPMGVY